MEVNFAKILSSICVLFVTITFGGTPYILFRTAKTCQTSSTKWNTLVALMNSSAAGVFISLFLIHLLPEVHDGLKSALAKSGIVTTFPVAEFVVSVGFFFVFVSELMFTMCKKKLKTEENTSLIIDDHSDHNKKHSRHGSIYENGECTSLSKDKLKYGSVSSERLDDLEKETTLSTESPPHYESPPGDVKQNTDIINTEPNRTEHDMTLTRALVMLIALAIHSMFEGLAVGLQDTNAKVWTITAGVLSHKWIIAFGFGTKLARTCLTTRMQCVYLIIFAIMAPSGILIGMGVSAANFNRLTHDMVTNILEAFATGTFLYVTFFEVLNKDIHNALNILFMILGFAVLTALKLVT